MSTDSLAELQRIMTRLRAEGGCPWDREQTHQSLKPYLIEECYELLEALDQGEDHEICEELGDVLLQVVFHAEIAREEDRFDLQQVAHILNEKLIRRHPHVFGAEEVADADGVVRQWEEIKKSEKQARGHQQPSVLDGVPQHFPALLQAHKLQKRAAKVGFDWPDPAGPFAKIREEIAELEAAHQAGDQTEIAAELGDLLFALVNLSRHLGVEPEGALRDGNAKFSRRFRALEARVTASGRDLKDCSLAELDAHWDAVKATER